MKGAEVYRAWKLNSEDVSIEMEALRKRRTEPDSPEMEGGRNLDRHLSGGPFKKNLKTPIKTVRK